MFFRCECGDLKGPLFHNTINEAKQILGTCVICQKAGPYSIDEVNTVYRNY